MMKNKTKSNSKESMQGEGVEELSIEQELSDQQVQDETSKQVTLSREEQLELEVQKNLDGWRRAQADYQNLQKSVAKERQDLIQYASSHIIMELIPMFDNFRLAVNHVPVELKDNAWVQGIEYILKQMIEVLEREGVEIIDPMGKTFDPYEHEAVERETKDSSTEQEERVGEVLQVGYRLHGKLIRSARVKVI